MINYEYPPLGGGGSNATKYILEQFSKGFDVEIDLVTTSSKNYYYTQSISSKVKIYFLPIKKKHLHYWKEREIFEFLIKAILFTRKLFRKKKYNLTHAIFGFPSGFIPFLYRNLPYIISLRGSDVPGFNVRFNLQYIFLKPLFYLIWKNAVFTTVNSRELKELAGRTLKNKTFEIIPNGIDMNEFQGKTQYREDPNSVIKVLTVSRLIKRKRIEDLLHSVKILKKFKMDIDLTIIGEGNNEMSLKNLAKKLNIAKNTHFKGYIPHSDLPNYYKEADVFVLPSLNEGMSNTALEALASGLPLILTNVGGSSELITDNGFIVNVRKPKQIADEIRKLYNNPDLNRKMGVNSRLHARHFDWKNVATKYFKLYKAIMNR